MFKKQNKYVSDDELVTEEKETIFSKLFKKKKESEENDSTDDSKKDDNKTVINDNSQIDFDTEYTSLNTIKSINTSISNIVGKLIVLIALVILGMIFIPKIMNSYNSARDEYASIVLDMEQNIVNYFNMEDQKCSTVSKDRYYFYIYNSKEMFGKEYVSPITGRQLEGYVEIDLDSNGKQSYYVSFTDGIFGISRTRADKLNKNKVGVFSFLKLERHESMKCDKSFVFFH